MNRVSGWYKRRAQVIVLLLALALSVALNTDTITIANSLSTDSTLRSAVVAAVEEAAKTSLTAPRTSLTRRIAQLRGELDHLGLPIGWLKASDDYVYPREVPTDAQGWCHKILGVLLTTIAVSLGAPFWFDFLNKLVSLREAGKESDRISKERGRRAGVSRASLLRA